MQNNTFAYTSSTLLNAYKKRRNELTPLLKKKKEKDEEKKIHLALLSIDLCIQIFNDANREFPKINKLIIEKENKNIPLIKNKTSGIKKLKKGIAALDEHDNIIFKRKMHYSIELANSSSNQIPSEIASNILKENAFLFTHILHVLYNNENQKEVFNAISAQLKYIMGLCIIEPISTGKDIYKEILKEREKYDNTSDELESFILNSHHYCLTILLFSKHWMGYRKFSLEEAEKALNEKINDILKQRKSNSAPAQK
ncbi:MAG: hypothetical protein L3I99_00810 [Sulfurimonas sp.]|nr:hypothetical protein [Sulfurimonas sp.]